MHVLKEGFSVLCIRDEVTQELIDQYPRIYMITGQGVMLRRRLSGNRFILTKVQKIPDWKPPETQEELNFLPAGKVPKELFLHVIDFFREVMKKKNSDVEAMIWVLWSEEKGYHLHVPEQTVSKASAHYTWDIPPGNILVVDIHSHNTMNAFFSGTDDNDDRKTICYSGVVGKLKDVVPDTKWRFNVEEAKYLAEAHDIFDIPQEAVTPVPNEWMDRVKTGTMGHYPGSYQSGYQRKLPPADAKPGDVHVGDYPGKGWHYDSSVRGYIKDPEPGTTVVQGGRTDKVWSAASSIASSEGAGGPNQGNVQRGPWAGLPNQLTTTGSGGSTGTLDTTEGGAHSTSRIVGGEEEVISHVGAKIDAQVALKSQSDSPPTSEEMKEWVDRVKSNMSFGDSGRSAKKGTSDSRKSASNRSGLTTAADRSQSVQGQASSNEGLAVAEDRDLEAADDDALRTYFARGMYAEDLDGGLEEDPVGASAMTIDPKMVKYVYLMLESMIKKDSLSTISLDASEQEAAGELAKFLLPVIADDQALLLECMLEGLDHMDAEGQETLMGDFVTILGKDPEQEGVLQDVVYQAFEFLTYKGQEDTFMKLYRGLPPTLKERVQTYGLH